MAQGMMFDMTSFGENHQRIETQINRVFWLEPLHVGFGGDVPLRSRPSPR